MNLRLLFHIRNLKFTEVPNYDYLRGLLKSILKKNGFIYDFYYDWCTTKPHIKSDDPIYTNDYKIEYNGKNAWLNNEVIKETEMKENGNNENIQVSKLGNNPGNSYSPNNAESSNSNTKYTDKKLSALPGVKKYK